MTQNVPKHSFLVLSATRWTCGRSVICHFFSTAAHESVGQKIIFCSDGEKKLLRIKFDGPLGNWKQDFFSFQPNGLGEKATLINISNSYGDLICQGMMIPAAPNHLLVYWLYPSDLCITI